MAEARQTPECEKARDALKEGDYRLARALADEVLANGSASPAAREEATRIRAATGIDRGAVVAGIIMLVVLAVLFAFAFTHHH